MNDLLRSNSEEEYHFPENETSSAYTSQKKSNNPRGFKKKNILAAIVIILLILCVYKLADVLLSSYKLHPLGNHNTPTIAPTPIQPVVTQPTVPVATVDDRLDAVEKMASDNQAQIDRLNSSMNDMQTSLTNLTDKINTLTNSLQDLTTKIQMQDEQIAALTPKPKPIVVHVRVVPKPIYFVKAIIPNRAWLTTPGGSSITVSVGDNLPGYGSIVEINAPMGTITTSSGAIIGYSPSDS